MSFQCNICTATFTLKHNLKRHIEKRCKKRQIPPENITQNLNPVPQNLNPVPQNLKPVPQNLNPVPQNVFALACSKCSKVFARKDSMMRHEQTCDGSQTLQCNVCLKIFASYAGKSRHKKRVICTPPPDLVASPMIINNNDNRMMNSNNITNNINNIQQININVHGKENYDVLLDTIRSKYPQAFVTMVEEGDTASLLKLVHFNKDFPENQTIRKPAKKDVSAEIHLGEGRWERRPTQEVIENFKGQTSKRLCNSLQTNVNTKDKHNDMYLKEVLYEQSKEPSGNTDSLLQPFMMSEQDFAEKDLINSVMNIKHTLMKEYPSLIGTKMFISQWKRESKPIIHDFENTWNTVVDNIEWTHV